MPHSRRLPRTSVPPPRTSGRLSLPSGRLSRALAGTVLAALPAAVLPVAVLPATTAAAAPAAERTVAGGRLDWGIKASFQSYVTGPIAKGRSTLLNGAATVGQSQFRFHSASGSYAPGSGAFDAAFAGGVRFTGHTKPNGTHELDLTISRPTVRISGGSGTLYADIRSKAKGSGQISDRSQVPLASLNLSGVNMKGGSGPITLSNIPAKLTAQGASSFAGYYSAGTPLDPVSLSTDLKPAAEKDGGEQKKKESDKDPDKKKSAKDAKDAKSGRIEDAAVDWGVRRTFREYVTGDLAKGTWKLSDGARDGGALFRFPKGEGHYDAAKHTLRADFAGRISFTGKNLDLALSGVSVRVADGKGTLRADVSRDGKKPVKNEPLVTFEAKKSALEPNDKGLVSLTEAPAKLTAEGAAAFDGMYPKGAAMDPVSLAVALDDKAELPALPDLGSGAKAAPAPGASASASAQPARSEQAAASSSSVPWIAGGAGAAVLLAGGAAFALVRRRRGDGATSG